VEPSQSVQYFAYAVFFYNLPSVEVHCELQEREQVQ